MGEAKVCFFLSKNCLIEPSAEQTDATQACDRRA